MKSTVMGTWDSYKSKLWGLIIEKKKKFWDKKNQMSILFVVHKLSLIPSFSHVLFDSQMAIGHGLV